MDSIRIMLAAHSADDRKLISSLLTDEALRVVSSFRPDADGLKKASSQPADVLLIGTRAMPSQELDFAERMFTTRSDITILLLAPTLDSQAAATLFIGTVQGLVMQAMLAGDMGRMRSDAPRVFEIYLRGIRSDAT